MPNDPADAIDPLVHNLITLLCAILRTRYSSHCQQFLLVSQCKAYYELTLFIYHIYVHIYDFILFSGEDGRSRAEQLFHILKQIDQYVSSPLDYQRKRGCLAVYEMLLKFRALCVTGYCTLGCQGSCQHIKQTDRTSRVNVASLPCELNLSYRFLPIFPRRCKMNYSGWLGSRLNWGL